MKRRSQPIITKQYECWKVQPVYEDYLDMETGAPKRRRKGSWARDGHGEPIFTPEYEQLGAAPFSTTHIDPKHAEVLNAQAENSGMYYYEVTE